MKEIKIKYVDFWPEFRIEDDLLYEILLKQSEYQVVISDMAASAGAGIAYTNPEAIKNRMMNYDANGNWVNPALQYGAKSNGKIFDAGKVDPQ